MFPWIILAFNKTVRLTHFKRKPIAFGTNIPVSLKSIEKNSNNTHLFCHACNLTNICICKWDKQPDATVIQDRKENGKFNIISMNELMNWIPCQRVPW